MNFLKSILTQGDNLKASALLNLFAKKDDFKLIIKKYKQRVSNSKDLYK